MQTYYTHITKQNQGRKIERERERERESGTLIHTSL